MQGNIDVSVNNIDIRNLLNRFINLKNIIFQLQKLTARYSMDKESNSTLQDMILLEKSTEKKLVAVDALMWLRRYLNICLYTSSLNIYIYAYLCDISIQLLNALGPYI